MAEHKLAQSYPVAIATGVQVILGAVVSAGWATIPDATINAIASVIALVVGTIAGVVAHSRVTPITGGWAAQVREVVVVALQDAVSQVLNSAEPAPDPTPVTTPSAGPAPSSERYTPPPTTPTATPAGQWVWTGETWSWAPEVPAAPGRGGSTPNAARAQRPGPALPRPAQPGPAQPGPAVPTTTPPPAPRPRHRD